MNKQVGGLFHFLGEEFCFLNCERIGMGYASMVIFRSTFCYR